MFQKIFFSALLLLTFAHTSAAQDQSDIEMILKCDNVKNPKDKLACFESAVSLFKKEQSREQSTRATPEGRFGAETITANKKKKRFKGVSEIKVTIERFWERKNGKIVFVLTNGQVWLETGSNIRIPKRASKARIKKSFSGGYMIYVKGAAKPGRVKRLR